MPNVSCLDRLARMLAKDGPTDSGQEAAEAESAEEERTIADQMKGERGGSMAGR